MIYESRTHQQQHSITTGSASFSDVLTAPATEDATTACSAAINSLRTTNLTPTTPLATLESDTQAEEAKSTAIALAGEKDKCEKGAEAVASNDVSRWEKYGSNFDAENGNFTVWTAPFDNVNASNVAFVMWNGVNSTTLFCSAKLARRLQWPLASLLCFSFSY
ncbi:SAG family member [Cyclospora cayetanensis]|uniref:SAG family member n=1 Tax=Cyclospora cayetanensis TaxID=88456 RepID=A0A1D3D5G2_9EIME|nr:SAG family member [Cyclospora cayetanensis]